MTKTSRLWRVKRINRIRVINKIHNLILGVITGLMTVFFLITLCSEINKYTIPASMMCSLWLTMVCYANEI